MSFRDAGRWTLLTLDSWLFCFCAKLHSQAAGTLLHVYHTGRTQIETLHFGCGLTFAHWTPVMTLNITLLKGLLHCWTVLKMRTHCIHKISVVYSAIHCTWIIFFLFVNKHNDRKERKKSNLLQYTLYYYYYYNFSWYEQTMKLLHSATSGAVGG